MGRKGKAPAATPGQGRHEDPGARGDLAQRRAGGQLLEEDEDEAVAPAPKQRGKKQKTRPAADASAVKEEKEEEEEAEEAEDAPQPRFAMKEGPGEEEEEEEEEEDFRARDDYGASDSEGEGSDMSTGSSTDVEGDRQAGPKNTPRFIEFPAERAEEGAPRRRRGDRLILFQMPNRLPDVELESGATAQLGQPGTPRGRVGKLLVYDDGTMELVLGGEGGEDPIVFNVMEGFSSKKGIAMRQEVARVDPGRKGIHFLGRITKKLVCTPQLNF